MTRSASHHIALSFELFPAKDEIAGAAIRRCVRSLSPMKPRFFSVTFGANGSDRARTLSTLRDLRGGQVSAPVAGHLTCAGGSRAATLDIARAYEEAGARWAVALRGDGDGGAGSSYAPGEGSFASSPELVAALRSETNLRIAVAGYPEPHPDSRGDAADMDHLKRKVDAGADAIITQFFFDNDVFFRYVEAARKAGIDVPIVPGIMPIRNFDKVSAFARKCGTTIPDRLAERFAKAKECGATRELALAVSAGQCDDLREAGVRAFHFYTLNDAELTLGTCQALGLDPASPVDGDGNTVDADKIPEPIRA